MKKMTQLITTDILGKAEISDQSYLDTDASFLKIDEDFSGNPRNRRNPTPGPFENPETGKQIRIKVW